MPPGQAYLLAVFGLLNEIGGAVYEVDLSEIEPGMARVRLLNFSPDAETSICWRPVATSGSAMSSWAAASTTATSRRGPTAATCVVTDDQVLETIATTDLRRDARL